MGQLGGREWDSGEGVSGTGENASGTVGRV